MLKSEWGVEFFFAGVLLLRDDAIYYMFTCMLFGQHPNP